MENEGFWVRIKYRVVGAWRWYIELTSREPTEEEKRDHWEW